jgi:glycosyltransferase involved in cell wall biosynthesis
VPRCLLVFEPPDGGVAENVLQLALGLPERGFEVALAGPEEAIVYDRLPPGTQVSRLAFQRGYGHPLQDLRALRALVRLMRAQAFDLVHCHSAKAGVLGRLAARMARTPVVYSPHCFPFVGPWGFARRQFSTRVERALGRRSDAIVCVADQERRLALTERVAPADRLHVVHNGCAPCEPVAEDGQLAAFAQEGPLAACVSVLRAQKSIDTFIRAAPLVLERMPEARLAVVGDGPMGDELHALAGELGLDRDERFRFFGFEPPASRQLQSLDVFVLPSAWEAFPISVLEAMACGVPQVATDVGGTSEALVDGETGRLCASGDVEALAERVTELLADAELRARMGAAARGRHAALFSVERMVDGTAAVYREVLGSEPPAQPEPLRLRHPP